MSREDKSCVFVRNESIIKMPPPPTPPPPELVPHQKHWVHGASGQIMDFYFMLKIIGVLSKDHVP